MQRPGSSKARGLCAGLDEVGMGCLAGPVCAVAVVFPTNATPVKGVGDSKKLSPGRRAELAPIVMREARFFGIGWAHPTVIDQKGLAEAWRRACLDALDGAPEVDLLMIDGNKRLDGFAGEQQSFVKGDARFWQIGAASIVAKVVRDLEMVGMSKHYPAYLWEKNMGYGSEEHLEALFRLGPTPYHRGLFLRKIWNRYADRIVKEQPAWMRWCEEWRSAPDDLIGQEDPGY
jgi:ribonuclease HII